MPFMPPLLKGGGMSEANDGGILCITCTYVGEILYKTCTYVGVYKEMIQRKQDGNESSTGLSPVLLSLSIVIGIQNTCVIAYFG